MSFLKYLKEFYDDGEETVDDIIFNYKSEIEKLIRDSDHTKSPEELNQDVKLVLDILSRALGYRNINNGKRFFDDQVSKHFAIPEEETLRKDLGGILNYIQRQATKKDPDFYV